MAAELEKTGDGDETVTGSCAGAGAGAGNGATPMPDSGDNVRVTTQPWSRRSSHCGKITLLLLSTIVLVAALDYYHFRRDCDCNIPVQEKTKRWNALQRDLKREVFGQHIGVDGTLRALYAHVTDPNPNKALVLSFHGWLGSGKTFVSQLIAKHFYEKGLESPHVKSFIGPRHFLLDPTELKTNQEKLSKIIERTVKECERSLFIFDEVDKMPAEIFDVLVPFLDHHGTIDGVSYRSAIFIFLSNTGGDEINRITANHLISEKQREAMSLYDFRQAGLAGAFTENGGLFQARMITQRLVDHFIPFLPLQREHVILCAKREMKRRNVLFIDPEKIADRVTFTKYDEKVYFAGDGCKNIVSHVGYYVHSSDSIFNVEL